MKSKHKPTANLPRRILACYVLFTLIGIVFFVVGLVFVNQSNVKAEFESSLETLVAKAKSAAVIANSCDGASGLQNFVRRLTMDESIDYCAVVGVDGVCLAHSTSELVGTVLVEPTGVQRQTTHYVETRISGSGNPVRELEVLLFQGRLPMGSLRIGVADQESWNRTWYFATRLPVLILPALVLLLLGGFAIQRLVTPMADVHDQLCRLASYPTISDANFELIPVKDAMSVGWNRLVQEIDEAPSSLDRRVSTAVSEFRDRQDSQLLDSLSDGVAQTDPEGKITFINAAMHALLGLESDSIDEQSFYQCLKQDMVEHTEDAQPLENLFNTGTFHRPAVTEIRKSFGINERVLRVARQPIRNQNGSSRSSDLKPAQAWSVRDITQQRLADQARDDFLDSATHELRTPLANIKAYAETLQMTEMIDIEQQKEFCNVINSEATRLARFIDELLDVSSFEAGSLRVEKQKVELRRLFDEALLRIRPLFDQKNIELESTLEEKLPEVALDKDKFVTCLVNLLGNAAKYTPENGCVKFRARVNNERLMVEVEDNGIGIKEEDLPSIFNKFYRCSDTRVHEQTGTGLGLTFAHEVIQLHDGTLTATSQYNQGSTFTISIPIE